MVEQVVAEVLRRRRSNGWLVGGTVRDRRLERYSPDLDVVVADDTRAFAKELAAALGSPWFPLSTRHGAYRVMAPEGHVDVAALQGTTIEEDLAHRDFTVNAMALSLADGELVDPFDGVADLRHGALAAVSDGIFRDDPLRLMRAPRFCHALGLHLDPALERMVREQAVLIGRAAGERVAAEIVLTLGCGRAGAAVRLWDDLGLLRAVLPEVGSAGDPCTLERLDGLLALPRLLADLRYEQVLWERLAAPVDGLFPRPAALRFATLLHTVTRERALGIARRLKLSSAMASLLSGVCGCFDSGAGVPAALQEAALSGRSRVSFLWATRPWEPEVLFVAAAAATSGCAGDPQPLADQAASLAPVRTLLAAWAARTVEGVPVLPVDGDVLMERLGLAPGPLLGRALAAARLAWEAGEAATGDELLEVAARAVDTGGAREGSGRAFG